MFGMVEHSSDAYVFIYVFSVTHSVVQIFAAANVYALVGLRGTGYIT